MRALFTDAPTAYSLLLPLITAPHPVGVKTTVSVYHPEKFAKAARVGKEMRDGHLFLFWRAQRRASLGFRSRMFEPEGHCMVWKGGRGLHTVVLVGAGQRR